MRTMLIVAVIFMLPFPILSQEKKDANPGDAMIEKYLAAETDKLTAKFLDGATTIEEWKVKRPRLHREYLDMLGLWPFPEKTPLLATKTGQLEAYGVVVENIHFQSKPGLYVTANVYRPRDDTHQYPAIVYVCGHSAKGRDGNKSAHQDHGFWFANNGYVCIILDSLQLGEIPGVHHGTYGQPWRHAAGYGMKDKDKLENRFWWHAHGYTPAGVEAWNGICAIDYLCTRPDVDPARIGVTGISGGGAATFWIAAADERVKVAVPVSGMSDLESYVKNKVINGHCDCMFLYNTYQWDWTTIAALVAPRPLLFANSDNDPIFPMDGNRRVIAKLRKIYAMYGVPNRVDDYVSPGGHAYRPDLRIAIFKFINKHLKGAATTPVEDCAKFTPLEGRKLRVFPEDSDLPKDALNGRIDQLFVAAAKVKLPEYGKFAEWKQGLINDLKRQCFAYFPDALPAAEFLVPRTPDELLKIIELRGPVEWKTEPHISALTQSLSFFHGPKRYVVIQPYDDTVVKAVSDFTPAYRLVPRGLKDLRWTNKSPPNYVERAHALLGRTVDQGRVQDIVSVLKADKRGKDRGGKEFEIEHYLIGKGPAGVLAAYAALFAPSVKEVIIIDPPRSHKDRPYFLNVLRILDIPEALGLLAPTPLTIIGGNDSAFDRTAEIYRLAGAPDMLKRK